MDKRYYILGGLLLLLIIVLILFLATRNRQPEKPSSSTITVWDSFDTEESFSDIFSQFLAENNDLNIKFVKKDPNSFEDKLKKTFKLPVIGVLPFSYCLMMAQSKDVCCFTSPDEPFSIEMKKIAGRILER